MNVAIYFSKDNFDGERLEAMLRKQVAPQGIEVFRTVDGLGRRFRRPGRTLDIVVLMPASDRELSNLLGIGRLLIDLRIVLILPDRSPETIARGHTLFPRYVSYADGDFSDVAAVLNKMHQNESAVQPLRSAYGR